ncbi:MAG: hypothetical protein HOI21_00305 [Bacteroidetes Order II. Incertae sedis bacterium]|nr:hypothetical protein [Bacteroidetes Order II. bacterium]
MSNSDSILTIREHLINVCMDLVEIGEEDEAEVQEDFEQMVDLILESLDLKITETEESKDSTTFNCTIQLMSNLQN